MNVVPTPTRVYRRRDISAPPAACNEILVDSTPIIVIRRRRPATVNAVRPLMSDALPSARCVEVIPEPVAIQVLAKPVLVVPTQPQTASFDVLARKWTPATVQYGQTRSVHITGRPESATSNGRRLSKQVRFARKAASLQRQLRELAVGLSDQTLGLTNKFSLAYGIRENLGKIWNLWSLESVIAGLENFAAYEALRQFIALARARQMKFDAVEARVRASLQALA